MIRDIWVSKNQEQVLCTIVSIACLTSEPYLLNVCRCYIYMSSRHAMDFVRTRGNRLRWCNSSNLLIMIPLRSWRNYATDRKSFLGDCTHWARALHWVLLARLLGWILNQSIGFLFPVLHCS